MRLDLPDSQQRDDSDSADLREYVTKVGELAARERPDRVIVVFYTEESNDDARLPLAELAELLFDELGLREIGCTEMLLVRDRCWYSYTCTKSCCPSDGTPLPEVPGKNVTEIEARRALSGSTVLPSREALAKSVAGPVALRQIELQQRFDHVGAELIELTISEGIEAVRQQTLSLARGMLADFVAGKHEIDDADAARVLIGLQDKWPRDVMMTWGLTANHREFVALLTALAQRAVDEHAAPVCTLLAVVVYQHGDGALASVALERALRLEPNYEMAILLDAALANRVHPKEIRAMIRRAGRALEATGTGDGRQAA